MTTEKLTEQDIEEMESAVAKATAEPWLKGHNPTSREPMEYIAEAYSYGPPGLVYLVCADGKPIDEEARFTAITGNGPTSEANAAFIARARSFVPRAIADLRRLREENERLARENSVILDGQAALKSDLELATERAERADAFSDLVDAVLDADIMSLPDEVRVARLRLLAMDGESPRRKEQP